MRRPRNAGPIVATGAAVIVLLSGAQSDLRAEVTQMGKTPRCAIRGHGPMAADIMLYPELRGGRPHARFTGAPSGIVATNFPEVAGEGRVRVQTGVGTGGFRVLGFADPSELPTYPKQAIPIVDGHVWIGVNRKVRILEATGGKILVERRLGTPFEQTLRAWEACDRFAFSLEVAAPEEPRRDARGFVASLAETDLFADGSSKGSPVFKIRPSVTSGGIPLWSTEENGPWVHVKYRGDVVIDAWARRSDLRPAELGEEMDSETDLEAGPPSSATSIDGTPRMVTPEREIDLRLRPSETWSPIGRIEVGTPTLVLEVARGWASVLPRSQNVAPTTGNQFWVRASDLGL